MLVATSIHVVANISLNIEMNATTDIINVQSSEKVLKNTKKKTNLKGVLLMCQYAVVDLEMCKVPNGAKKGKYRWKHETIQIAIW